MELFYRLCLKVLNDDKKLWEDEVYKFARKHQLEVVYDLQFSSPVLNLRTLIHVL